MKNEEEIAALVEKVSAEKSGWRRQEEADEAGEARVADADGGQDEGAPVGGRVAAQEKTVRQQHGHAEDSAEGDGKELRRQGAGGI